MDVSAPRNGRSFSQSLHSHSARLWVRLFQKHQGIISSRCPPSGIRSQISFSNTYRGRAATKKCVSCPEPRQGSFSHDWLTLCSWERVWVGLGIVWERHTTTSHFPPLPHSAAIDSAAPTAGMGVVKTAPMFHTYVGEDMSLEYNKSPP